MGNSVRRPTSKICLVILLLLFTAATVQAVEYSGTAEVSYSGWLDKKEKAKAETAALHAVIEGWIAQHQQSLSRNYYKVKKQIDANVHDYIINAPVIIDAVQDKSRKKYKVVLRAVINEPLLLRKINEDGAMASGSAKINQDAYITFVFVARQAVGTQSKSEKEAVREKTEGKGIAKDKGKNSATLSKTKRQKIRVEESQTQYADQVVWDVSTANEIDVAMGDVFTNANLNVVDAAFLMDETNGDLDPEKFVEEYRTGDDITPATKNAAIQSLKSLADPVQYFAIGTLDVQPGITDPVTGHFKVPVCVTGQIYSVFQRGISVAKVGPETYLGLGPTQLVAKNNALKKAASQAAKSLVAKFSARGNR